MCAMKKERLPDQLTDCKSLPCHGFHGTAKQRFDLPDLNGHGRACSVPNARRTRSIEPAGSAQDKSGVAP